MQWDDYGNKKVGGFKELTILIRLILREGEKLRDMYTCGSM